MASIYTVLTLGSGVYTNAANYVGGAAPVAADDLFAQYDASQSLSGSDQSATELGDINVLPTCSGGAGSADTYLQLDQATSAKTVFAGSGRWYLDLGSSGSALVRVDRTASARNGEAGLYFKNDTSAIAKFEVNGGVVRLAGCNITTLIVREGATVYIEEGSTIGTIKCDGGTVIDYGCSLTTWDHLAGSGVRYGSDAYAVNMYGGTFYNDATGTATAVLYGGLFDSARDNQGKSVTLTVNGGTAKIGPNVTLTEAFNLGVTISA